jgi:hypothetical protein
MVRKIISILFYIIGGFFVYMVCLLSFFNKPQLLWKIKFAIVGGFCIPAILFLVIGAAIRRFQNWKSNIGAALLSGVGFNLLVVVTFICLLLTPGIDEYAPKKNITSSIAHFNDYLTGLSVMSILAFFGLFLLKKK